MSDDTERSWWPEGYRHPAFEVKRRTVGSELHGDYTRGSAGYHADGDDESPTTTLPTTALRFPTRALEPSAFDITARGLLFAQAFDYDTIKIVWHMPTSIYDTFTEMSIVRSSYGAPSDPMQGQTVMRRKRSEFVSVDGQLIPPVIYDQFVSPRVPDLNKPGEFREGILASGRWYYYTAFFTTNGFDWAAMMSDSCLLPRDYAHSDHLWNAIPPYYQWVDSHYNKADYLKRFLTIFGFELDRWREYIESLLELHYVDQCPMPLLKQLGANYGYAYEEGIGDVRYRALMANISHMLTTRGTAVGLLELVETVSKYDCDVTQGANNVLVVDDSNFVNGLGHWAPIHPDVPLTMLDGEGDEITWLDWDDVTLKHDDPAAPSPPAGAPGSVGVMAVNSTVLGNIMITAGAGKRANPPEDPDTFVPYYHGIPVSPKRSYGMSAWVKTGTSVDVYAIFIPFTSHGQALDVVPTGPMIGLATVRPDSPHENDWFQVTMLGTMPAGAEYLVPALLFNNRSLAPHYVAAVMIYQVEAEGEIAVPPPSDRYLTMGEPAEKIGAPTDDDGTGEPYEGFPIGSPISAPITGGAP